MKFSVLITFYYKNSAKELDTALNSIFQNSLQPDEVILVQDGNVSNELHYIKDKYIDAYNVKFIELKENKGLIYALNEGLKYVTTEIILRADADDINCPDRFKKQINLFKSGADVCGGDIAEIDNNLNLIGYRKCPKSHEKILKRLKYRNPINHMTVGFRKHAIESVGGYPNIDLREDYALWAKMIKSGYIFKNCGDVFVKARAGKEMYKRRSGLNNVVAEIRLQIFMVQIGVQSVFFACFICCLRSFIFILPNKLRGLIYEAFLRK